MSTTLIAHPDVEHLATLIFIHGLGDTGRGWFYEFSSYVNAGIRVVCPTAPKQPVTRNGGAKTTSWYDIKTFDKRLETYDGIEKSTEISVCMHI